MSKTFSDALIENIYRDKWMIRFITQCRDLYGYWLWPEIVAQYRNERGSQTYMGANLLDPRIEMKKMNEMIAGL